MQELRETWDSAIADLPPDIKALLEKPKRREPLAVVAKRKGTETLAKWLTDKLANGPKDKASLTEAYKSEGKGERIRFKDYIETGVIKLTADKKIALA